MKESITTHPAGARYRNGRGASGEHKPRDGRGASGEHAPQNAGRAAASAPREADAPHPHATRIKICGLTRPEDAVSVNRAGPDYAGFVFYGQSRRNVSADQARALRAAIDPGIRTVGVFVNAAPETVFRLCRDGIIDTVQLHGNEDAAYLAALRDRLPGVEIWQAFRVRAPEDLALAARSLADQVLLDSGGGTGTRFDWSLLAGFPRPFILAGGLTPQNIPDAMERLHPYAVDISSGVETAGQKDEALMIAAVAATRRG